MRRDRMAKADEVATADPDERVVTIPNAISVARLAGVPVFLWLVLGLQSEAGDWWAVGLLIAAGLSDWLDGKIARALNQQSRLGQVLDPAADRLYIVATVAALAIRSIIPWWLVGLLAARELLLGLVLLVLRRHGYAPLQVSFVGKAATLALLYAFPLLFLGAHPTSYAEVARVAGWAFAIWGTALYWCAALLYVEQARRLIRADSADLSPQPPPDAGGSGGVVPPREDRGQR
ncbi:MAG TPA: CDP-alcohol phosphatidyltransferase family protein [Streptosporangiaceae bacterium]